MKNHNNHINHGSDIFPKKLLTFNYNNINLYYKTQNLIILYEIIDFNNL